MSHRLLPSKRVGAVASTLAFVLLRGAVGADGAAAVGAQGPDSKILDSPLVLAPAAVRDGTPVDGIPAGDMVSTGYHIHAHLTMFVNGVMAWVPAGIGVTRPVVLDPKRKDPMIIAATGYYWLHTHDESGVIHAEAPQERVFTLGQFFDVWGQPLSRHQIGPARGDVTVLVDGRRFPGDPRDVVLRPHEAIQLNLGQEVEFLPFEFPPNF